MDPQGIEINIRGPYGTPGQNVDGFDRIILISGGFGTTSFASVCKHICYTMLAPVKDNISTEMQLGQSAVPILTSQEIWHGLEKAFQQGYEGHESPRLIESCMASKNSSTIRERQCTSCEHIGLGVFGDAQGSWNKRCNRAMFWPERGNMTG